MVELDTTYDGDVAQLITFGTPHLGTPVQALLQDPIVAAAVLKYAPRLDQGSDGVRDMDLFSPFLSQLNSKPLPPSDYKSIVSFGPIPENCYPVPVPGLNAYIQDFVLDALGPSDCVVPVANQDLKNVVIVNPEIRSRIGFTINAFRRHMEEETKDYGKILCALGLGCLIVTSGSPIDLEITGPNGLRISKSLNEIVGAAYDEGDIDGDGELNDVITIPLPLAGNYQIKVIPDSGANPNETYSLETNINGVTTILAQNQRLQDIPTQPSTVKVPLQVKIDIKPGSGPNCINPTAKGTTTVAVLGKDFDVKTINVGTIRIDGDSNPATIGISPVSVTYGDVDKDRKTDLVLQFSTLQLNGAGMFSDGKTLYITGELTDGMQILGSDLIFLAGGPNCS